MIRIFHSFIFLAFFSYTFATESCRVAEDLARRVVPELSGRIVFREIKAETDTFAVSASDGKVLIEGSSPIAMCVGLNNYLRSIGTNVSWFVEQPVYIPETIELPQKVLEGNAAVRDRFFLNYCTFGYTMPFWGWSDWERFIDWMALNGINMPLAMTGQEKVWFETWRQLGLDDESILASFTGPAHLPWHWMANIDHFQGPLTLNWLESAADLQKNILARERSLGMKPVLPAFAGHVPEAFKDLYPDADITSRRSWCGFKGKDVSNFLNPSDSLYAVVQSKFLSIQDSIFGTDHIYGIDPFNEIDSPDWSEEFLRSVSSNIFSTLTDVDPNARWVQMTWTFYNDPGHWTKPRIKAFLEGVPADGLILLDYYCEAQPVWEITEAYFGKPYILCYLGNFGGNTMIIGSLNDVNDKINNFYENGGSGASGIGGTLEGLDVNPVIHEFVFAKVWNPELTPEKWIEQWADSRGAKRSKSVANAWEMLNEKVYVDRTLNGQGGLTNLRPVLDGLKSGIGNAAISYDNSNLVQALDSLLAAADQCSDLPSYRFDVMNLARQAGANHFATLRDRLADAYRRGESDSVVDIAMRMDRLMLQLDSLMASHPDYSLKKWVNGARSFGHTEAECDALETNARTILTLWGYPSTVLNDYANRHWSGLISGFYRQRWKIFSQELINSMNQGVPFDEDACREAIILFEQQWADSHEPLDSVSTENPIPIAIRIRNAID